MDTDKSFRLHSFTKLGLPRRQTGKFRRRPEEAAKGPDDLCHRLRSCEGVHGRRDAYSAED